MRPFFGLFLFSFRCSWRGRNMRRFGFWEGLGGKRAESTHASRSLVLQLVFSLSLLFAQWYLVPQARCIVPTRCIYSMFFFQVLVTQCLSHAHIGFVPLPLDYRCGMHNSLYIYPYFCFLQLFRSWSQTSRTSRGSSLEASLSSYGVRMSVRMLAFSTREGGTSFFGGRRMLFIFADAT